MGTFAKTLLATTLALSSPLAFAEGEMKNPPIDPTAGAEMKPSFEQHDVNRDGMITKDEVPATHELSSLFASVDANSDGKLSRAEFSIYADDEAEEEAAE
jgi:Ca2+-binding EF-hand superfamily protein